MATGARKAIVATDLLELNQKMSSLNIPMVALQPENSTGKPVGSPPPTDPASSIVERRGTRAHEVTYEEIHRWDANRALHSRNSR